jgi:hypothetical protein
MSKTKRPSLIDAVNQTNEEKPADLARVEEAGPNGRKDKRIVSGHFDLAVSKQLKQIAAEEDTTIQDLLREALNDFFTKRGRLPIA